MKNPPRVRVLRSAPYHVYKGLREMWYLECGHTIEKPLWNFGKHPKTTTCYKCLKHHPKEHTL